MKNIKKIITSTFLIFLLANVAFGFPGMGGGNASNTTTIVQIPENTRQIDLNNATDSDLDITMIQHLVEVDAVALKPENKLTVRETLIFNNTGSKDFYGNLRTWIQDGSDNIRVSRSEMMAEGVPEDLNFTKDGNIITWKDYLQHNTSLRNLYVIEYSVSQTGTGAEKFSKEFNFPPLINYKYMEKPGLSAIVLKIMKSEGTVLRFTNENGNKIDAGGSDETSGIYRFSPQQFKEINVEISQSSSTPAGTQSYAAYIVIGILIILVLLYPFIKKKLKSDEKGKENKRETVEKTIEKKSDEALKGPSRGPKNVPPGKLQGKDTRDLEVQKQDVLSKLKDLEKEYESGNLLDEEYEDTKKSYQDKLKEIETKYKR